MFILLKTLKFAVQGRYKITEVSFDPEKRVNDNPSEVQPEKTYKISELVTFALLLWTLFNAVCMDAGYS